MSGMDGGDFQTLEDLREQLRVEVEAEAAAVAVTLEDEVAATACSPLGLEEEIAEPARKRRTRREGARGPTGPRRQQSPPPALPEKKPRARKARTVTQAPMPAPPLDLEYAPESQCPCANPCAGNCADVPVREEACEHECQDPCADACAAGGVEAEVCPAETLEASDLELAVAAIARDLRKLTLRVNALSTVMSDAQSMQVSRCYSALVRSLERLQAQAYGGSQGLGSKKPRAKRVLRV